MKRWRQPDIKVHVYGSEVIQTPTVLIEDQESYQLKAEDIGSVYSVGPNDNGSADFLIAFKDRAGNLGDNVSGPSSQNQITLDNDDPYLTEVIIVSDNDNSSSLARVGDNLTLTSNEDLQVPAANLGTILASWFSIVYDWEVVVQVTDNMTSMAVVSISVSVMDLAGNSITNVTSADNTSVLIDRYSRLSVHLWIHQIRIVVLVKGDNLTIEFHHQQWYELYMI